MLIRINNIKIINLSTALLALLLAARLAGGSAVVLTTTSARVAILKAYIALVRFVFLASSIAFPNVETGADFVTFVVVSKISIFVFLG